jgi:hypothetical protein
MKILGLSLLLLCLVAISQAQTSSTPPTKDPVTAAQDSHAALEPFVFKTAPDRIWTGSNSDFFCAHMRTYRVKRKYRGSDVVTPAGYTKCVPTRRFELRSAVQMETEPDSRE